MTANIIQGDCLERDDKGRFISGGHYSPSTEFKKGEHWRPEKPYWNKDWLETEYSNKSAGDIARDWGVTIDAILFWLRKHGITRRTISQARLIKKWGQSGENNPMFGKTGINNQNWKGGCTPDRQSFYMSHEWKAACRYVYKRDCAKCVRCGSETDLHIHHIISFSIKEYRSNTENLVLLCKECHGFIHSKKNIAGELIGKEG